MTPSPDVSVIVPHFSDLANLDLCLSGLVRQTYPTHAFEIVVADNGSPEGAERVASVIGGRARLVIVAKKGAGPARNGGAAEATGAILAFTDSDCRPAPDWLAQGVAALAGYDFVGGAMEVLVQDASRMTATEAFERVFAFDNETYVLQKGFTVSANLLCARQVFESVGGFGVGVSEDLDWCHRAREAGFRIGYARRAVVGHPARRSWVDLVKKWRRLNAETFGLYARRRAGRLVWAVRACLLPMSAVAHTPKVLTSPGLTSGGQRLAALGTLYRLRLWRTWDSLRLLAHDPARA